MSEGAAGISWARATASAIAIVAVGFVGVVYLPDLLLTALNGLGTQTRSLIVTGLSIGAVVLVASGLRFLQDRRLI